MRASNKRREVDGRAAAYAEKARLRREAERQADARPCPYCGSLMTHKRRVQCGAPECAKKHNTANQRRQQLKHKAEKGQWLTDKYQVTRTCIQCGITWKTRPARNAKYCSNTCQAAYEHGPERLVDPPPAWFRKKLRKAAKAARGTRNTRPWVVGNCARCGDPFTTALTSDLPKYCSVQCKARDSASRRRALTAGAKITFVRRWYIYERDRWTCHICGDPVNRGATAPDLDAPVLDHVIALTRGGTHTEDNLRTAHFYCNSVKRELDLAELT
ncbi:HNH endonuclease [Nonomuraea sp. CA-218870]|uniref:HNH endonuclease n=1 Tax=Nonomuraea sp. CA-218870 TaxID=3239998 RepID=UPI003D8E70EF